MTVELTDLLAPLEPELEAMRSVLARELESDDPAVATMLEHLSRFRGKQLRATLLLLMGRASGNEHPELPEVAAIVEMIRLATLVHDDVLDGAEVRRQLPSVNLEWDNQNAVLLGDWLYARAFSLSTRLSSPLASQVLAEVTSRICVGEIRQAQGRYAFEATVERYEEVATAKTGVLYGAAAELGVRFGRSEADVLGAEMRALGEELGLAFQIADDLLDLEGEESVVGKSVGTDVDDGKVTLPVLLAWRSADLTTREGIEAAYRAPGVPDRRAALFAACDLGPGLTQARARADELIASARGRLSLLPDTDSRQALESVLEFTLERRN